MLVLVLIVSVCITSMPALSSTARAQLEGQPTAAPLSAMPFGYGLVMANAEDHQSAQSMGFNWIMTFDPTGFSADPNVLRRVTARRYELLNLPAFRSRVVAAAANVQAIQIGNEPNLDSEWWSAPIASEYSQLLCEAYTAIKQAYPNVIVVSGGLAPTGRVPGMWNNHRGHDGYKQDEREYLKEFIAAGGANCLDALGYNALGFRADFNAAPDINGGTADTDCASGLCFRSVEKAYEIMQSNGLGHKPIWATEVGWLTPPVPQCLSDYRWPTRTWQIVTPEKQAQNLVGAFTYARSHWPWLQAMFVFNLDFSSVPWYDNCEQMRYYSVNRQPTYDALVSMSKNWTYVYLPLTRK
jgi:hypothetical protein